MLAATALLAATLPAIPVGERSLFHVPREGEVRLQSVARNGNEKDWPFSVGAGKLACVWSVGTRQVFFIEGLQDNVVDTGIEPRMLVLSVDPLYLTLGNIPNRTLFAPMADVADLVRRVGPFIAMGERLCDQPPGTQVRAGEL